MPLKGFKYSNGETVSIEEVKRGDVDIARIGVSLPTLLHMSKSRPPDRKPSTTELLNGTCQSYLERTADYYIHPEDNAFSLAGTLHHLKLEESSIGMDRLKSELTLESDGITGTVDLYDKDTKTLVDYKFSGSYKIAKCLGVQFKYVNHPTEVYKRSGRWGKAGSPKRIKEFYIDKNTADLEDWGWQLNFYRYLLESNGYEVHNMFIQATVRDAGLQIARERGIDRKIYMIEIPHIDNSHLIKRFREKREELIHALYYTKKIPSVCTEEETWGGVKCKSYCPVREVCPYNNTEGGKDG
jgi:CRISPR/Cas system-associated exonuclease Cas4 (RecB family)|tara:strand:- start:128 stop:1021 length:894 start_codon:yes stop_codon:yes gene_type:complete